MKELKGRNKLADLIAQTSGELSRVEGWDEMAAVGLEVQHDEDREMGFDDVVEYPNDPAVKARLDAFVRNRR